MRDGQPSKTINQNVDRSGGFRAVNTLLGQNTSQSQGLRVSTPGTAGIASCVRHPSASPPLAREWLTAYVATVPRVPFGTAPSYQRRSALSIPVISAGVQVGRRYYFLPRPTAGSGTPASAAYRPPEVSRSSIRWLATLTFSSSRSCCSSSR